MANYSTYGEFLFMDNLGGCYLIRKAHYCNKTLRLNSVIAKWRE